MPKRFDQWHIMNIFLTVLAFVLPLLRSWVLAQQVGQQIGEATTMDVIYKITVVGSVLSVAVGIVVTYNLYKVIFALSSLEVSAKYRYFSQLVATVSGICVSFWLSLEALQSMPWLFAARDIVTGVLFLGLLWMVTHERHQEPEWKSHFLKASVLVMILHIVMGVFTSFGGGLS